MMVVVVVSSFHYLRTFECKDITQFEIEKASSVLSGAATSSSDISTVV